MGRTRRLRVGLGAGAFLLSLASVTAGETVSPALSPSEAARTGAAEGGIDLSSVVETVRHHIKVSGGVLRTEDPLYRVQLDRAGFAMTLRETRDRFDTEPGFAIRSVGGGSWRSEYNVARRAVAPGVTERVTARDGRLEWDFVLSTPKPAGFRVEAEVHAEGPPTLVRDGRDDLPSPAWRYPVGENAVRVGEMMVVDARGEELYRALPTPTGARLMLAVPATVLARATYPVTIDPVVSPEYALDSAGFSELREPAIAWSGASFLVAWVDTVGGVSDVRATRVTSTGSILDPGGIAMGAEGNPDDPAIAWNGSIFLVAWSEFDSSTASDIYAARVSPAGVNLDPARIALTTAAEDQTDPDVASDGSNFLVLWAHSPQAGSGSTLYGILGKRVSAAGAVLDAGLTIHGMYLYFHGAPSVAWNGANYLAVWIDERTAPRTVYHSRLSPSGTVLDPNYSFGTNGPAVGTSVASNGTDFFLTFTEYSGSPVRGARVSAAGTSSGTGFSSDKASLGQPTVAWNGADYVVAWSATHADPKGDIIAARVTPVGASGLIVRDPGGIPVSTSTDAETAPRISAGPRGRTGIVYERGPAGMTRAYLRFLDDPANDIFASARAITGASGQIDGVNVAASKEAGEPNHAGNVGGASVWYAWTPPANGPATIDTVGSTFNTLLGVYTGSAVSTLTPVASDDDSGGNQTSRVSFNAYSSQTYRIAVDGFASSPVATGVLALHWSLTPDLVAPETTITAGPSGPTASTSASFSFTSSEPGSTFECKLDAGSYGSCTSPKTYTGMSESTHTFSVRATDVFLNTDLTADTRSWTADVTAPVVTITSGPSGTVSSTIADFSFTSNEAVTGFQCKLDAGPPVACASPKSYTGLAQGSHTFTVSATDLAGNGGSQARTWIADTVTPTITITSGPSGTVASADATFTFTASEPVTGFECKLEPDPFAPCSSPVTYAALPEGSHTFRVRATDVAGNVGSNARTWISDTVPPSVTVDGPSGLVHEKSAIFSWTANEPSTFECSLDAAALATCTSPKSYQSLPDGTYTFTLRATDVAGNSSSYARSWIVDAPPETTITEGPPPWSKSRNATFTFTADQPAASFSCRLDGAGFSPCVSPKTYPSLSEGQHEFQVRATDPGNNTGPVAIWSWIVDTTPPTLAFTLPVPGLYVDDRMVVGLLPERVAFGPITVEVRAADSDSEVAVAFSAVDTLGRPVPVGDPMPMGSDRYRVVFHPADSGRYTITAKATNEALAETRESIDIYVLG